MDDQYTSELISAGFRRPPTVHSRFTTPGGIYTWQGLRHTAAPFDIDLSQQQIDLIVRRSSVLKTWIRYTLEGPHPKVLEFPVPIYTNKNLGQVANPDRPEYTIPIGQSGRELIYPWTDVSIGPIDDTGTFVGPPPLPVKYSRDARPTIAMHMSVLATSMCILISRDFKPLSFSGFLASKMFEFLHIANSLDSPYLALWGLEHICNDDNVFKYLHAMSALSMIPKSFLDSNWAVIRDRLLSRACSVSYHIATSIAPADLPVFKFLKIRRLEHIVEEQRRRVERFWGQYRAVPGRQATKCIRCDERLGELDFSQRNRETADFMICCMAPVHRRCLLRFLWESWTCPHQLDKAHCRDIWQCVTDSSRSCFDDDDIIPEMRYTYCPKCHARYRQGYFLPDRSNRELCRFIQRQRALFPMTCEIMERVHLEIEFVLPTIRRWALVLHGIDLRLYDL